VSIRSLSAVAFGLQRPADLYLAKEDAFAVQFVSIRGLAPDAFISL
jgi:hypothetical protein